MLIIDDFDGIWLWRDTVDMRKQIDGLAALVESEMEMSPFERNLYLFCSRNRDRMKILYWRGTGFALWMTRLEKEKFHWPRKDHEEKLTITAKELRFLLSGLDIRRIQPHQELDFQSLS